MKVHIVKDYMRVRIDIYMYHERHDGRDYLLPEWNKELDKVVYKTVFVPYDQVLQEDIVKPIISLNEMYAGAFIEGIAEWAKNEGISVKEQSNLAGKLKATEDHLNQVSGNFDKLLNKVIEKL